MIPADCHPDRKHKARGLCGNCYFRMRYHGESVDWFRRWRTRDEFLDDYLMLRGQGFDDGQIAERMGMTRGGVYIAVYRARVAGDPRVS